jgi:hypothetical protein
MLLVMEDSVERSLARVIASGRVAIGAVAIAAPTLMARPWIGEASAGTGARLLARTMGGRDLVLGIGALRALGVSDQEARPWLALGGTADAVDALATLIAFGSLPRRTRWGILAMTVTAAIASIRVAVALDTIPPVRTPATGSTPAPT